MRHQLDEYASKHGLTESAVIQAALENHFAGIGDKQTLYGRLDHMTRTIGAKATSEDVRELRQLVVAQGYLLRQLFLLWLSRTQPPSAAQSKAQYSAADATYRQVVDGLGNNLLKGRTLLDDLPSEVRLELEARVRWLESVDDEPRPTSSARPDKRAARSAASTPPDQDDDPLDDEAPDDDVWIDTEPDDEDG